MKNLLVSIVVCTKDRAEILEKYALPSLFNQNYKNHEIIIVDDASKDNTLQMLNEYKDKIKVVKNRKSRGLSYVRNLGIKNANGEFIAFIDDDCIADKNWIKELVKSFLKDPEMIAIGGKILIEDSNRIYNSQKQIYGCNMAFRSRIFEKFLFDTNLYFNKCSWHDETELLYRLKNKGIKIRYNHKAIVRHFKMPAEYRKNFETGAPMNRVYMYSKKISLPAYYQILFSSLKSNNVTREQDYLTEPMKAATGLLFSKNKNPLRFLWLLYVLFFSIPIKAKIQDAKEEKKFAHYLLQR